MITKQTGRLNDNQKPDDKPSEKVSAALDKSKKAKGAFRTISEVADELDVQQHVLRFWETKFSQIRPLKRGGGRRYYRPEDVAVLKRIYDLLYTEGYTIKGVQKLFRANGKQSVMEGEVGGAANTDMTIDVSSGSSAVQENTVESAAIEEGAQAAHPEAHEQVSEPETVIKHILSDTQRKHLHSALSELRELRALVQAG